MEWRGAALFLLLRKKIHYESFKSADLLMAGLCRLEGFIGCGKSKRKVGYA